MSKLPREVLASEYIKGGRVTAFTIIRRGDGSAMRSLLALAIILAFSIDLSTSALTVPRMRKRELPPMWQDVQPQPEYVTLIIMSRCSFLNNIFFLSSLEAMLDDVMEDTDGYDYKWDRYQER